MVVEKFMLKDTPLFFMHVGGYLVREARSGDRVHGFRHALGKDIPSILPLKRETLYLYKKIK